MDRQPIPDLLTTPLDTSGRTALDACRERLGSRQPAPYEPMREEHPPLHWPRALLIGRADYSLLDERIDQ